MFSTIYTYVLSTVCLACLTSQQQLLQGVFNFLSEGQTQLYEEPPDVANVLPEYDFIVIGAGTAGCVVANRLSENPEWNVLLIEAGSAENFLMDFPILANYLQFTASNWKYKTMPSDRYCMGMDGGQCNFPRGKVMGGSSVLNYMIYTRGNWRDYDNWEKMGNTGWSYKDVLPYYKKIETFFIPEKYDESYHGKDGYLSIGYPPYHTKIAEAIVNSAIDNGLNYTDYNGRYQVGVSYLQTNIKDGLRHSASRAYLHPIRHRTNLHVKKNAMVTKILIDPTTKQTKGVEFIVGGRKIIVGVKKEVISSAGAINGPQLLMLSGIGPRKHLRQLGIPVLSNLKVGYNLMDHIALGGLTFMINQSYSLNINRIFEGDALTLYLNNHTGPMSVPGGCEVLTFHDLKNPGDPDGYPDMELLFIAGSLVSDDLLYKDFGITENLFNTVYGPIKNRDSFMVFPMLLRPKSKGRIMLQNDKPLTKPLIYPNYFAHKEDMDTIIGGVRELLKIIERPALKALGTKLHDIPIPQCAHLTFASDEYFNCMARYLTFNIYHQSGTCKMGTDKKAVVDPRLRVYGIKGLRVMDASVIPEIPAAHTNAPVFMIAEKGSDMIKQDWGYIK